MANGKAQPPTDWRPRPDPTLLTTEALHREIAALKEIVLDEIKCERELRETKIEALHTEMMGHWHLDDSREHRLDDRLAAIEAVRIEQKQDTAKAIEAALTAQEAAAEKSEKATTKQLEEIKATMGQGNESLRREMGDLKERIGAVENRGLGAKEQKAGLSTSTGLAIAAVSAFVAMVGVVTAIIISTA